MTHDHDHTHEHAHAHSHAHEHSHHHDHGHGDTQEKEMTMDEKLAILLAHWVDHNESHKESFISWAQKAREEGLSGIAEHLEEAGRLSDLVSKEIEKARDGLKQS